MASALNLSTVKRELLNVLRNLDVISKTTRNVTTTTDTFSGNGVQTAFDLTESGVKNIREVLVDSVPLDFLQWDYTEAIVGGVAITTIEFASAPASGTNNIDITYDYSSEGDRIYPDFPKSVVSNSKFPRIGFDVISTTSQELALGGTALQSGLLISINCYGVGTKSVDDIMFTIRQYFINNKNSLKTINFITPESVGALLITEGTNGKIVQRNLDLIAPFEFELE